MTLAVNAKHLQHESYLCCVSGFITVQQ